LTGTVADRKDMVAPAACEQAGARKRGDPVRWYRGHHPPALRTLQKEIGAALEEAKNACRQGPAPDAAPA
jgi:hypothetical protein